MENLERYFEKFRKNILGINATFESPYGSQKIIYADWIASGRLYEPIENKMHNYFGPMVGNTHSEASETGVTMTFAYHLAKKIIKKHVNANENDLIISAGSGMTGMVNKLQRILGLKVPERTHGFCKLSTDKIRSCITNLGEERPVVFITHMEHHSNHTSWLETIAEVVIIPPDENLLVNPENLRLELEKYKNRKTKIGSFSAASNVTGIKPDYYELAKIMHEHGGICFIDFAASAPYEVIDMHPQDDPMKSLDAIFFSPHKFLGGPGSSGVLIFNDSLYHNKTPDQPGGGTVTWTNRWGEYSYINDIEIREDGGTPAFLQTIRAALSLKLKEKMGCENIHNREKELLKIVFEEFSKIKQLKILAGNVQDRIGAVSFYIENIHHNLIVKLLNDRFGIQMRGGCSCAGTYGHFLLNVDIETSHAITCQINQGDLTEKPGWVRMSIHPTMTNQEIYFIIDALNQLVKNIDIWKKDFVFSKESGEWYHKKFNKKEEDILSWFEIE
jgi:selenocysteine lyase/cysteine desulfurase